MSFQTCAEHQLSSSIWRGTSRLLQVVAVVVFCICNQISNYNYFRYSQYNKNIMLNQEIAPYPWVSHESGNRELYLRADPKHVPYNLTYRRSLCCDRSRLIVHQLCHHHIVIELTAVVHTFIGTIHSSYAFFNALIRERAGNSKISHYTRIRRSLHFFTSNPLINVRNKLYRFKQT